MAVEADWPDAYRVNRFVRGESDDTGAEEALSDFRRFPVWMWRNVEVAEFVTLAARVQRRARDGSQKVGFYGLDLYSLHRSMEKVVEYLDRVDPAAAERARERYACFDQFGRDPQVYAYEAGLAGAEPCEQQAVQQLVELQAMARGIAGGTGTSTGTGTSSPSRTRGWWSTPRSTTGRCSAAASRAGTCATAIWPRRSTRSSPISRPPAGRPRSVVWAHNSHLGDERATELAQAGQLNLGQLMREKHGDDTLLVGFTTYEGTVTAASDWGAPAERKRVRRALPGSWEELFHERELGPVLARSRRAAGPAAGARDRRRLPARDRARLALLPRPARRPVRRGDPH